MFVLSYSQESSIQIVVVKDTKPSMWTTRNIGIEIPELDSEDFNELRKFVTHANVWDKLICKSNRAAIYCIPDETLDDKKQLDYFKMRVSEELRKSIRIASRKSKTHKVNTNKHTFSMPNADIVEAARSNKLLVKQELTIYNDGSQWVKLVLSEFGNIFFYVGYTSGGLLLGDSSKCEIISTDPPKAVAVGDIELSEKVNNKIVSAYKALMKSGIVASK